MKSILTTILDFCALAAIVTGGFLIHIGLGVMAAGAAVGVASLLIERLTPDPPEDRRPQ